ncbi:MAG: cupin domain-containing protein [Candidatus Nealsonbacteria bacterium]|nr:cupin domain-containing protein [Candidatus Nealsonbacteria bacterium]
MFTRTRTLTFLAAGCVVGVVGAVLTMESTGAADPQPKPKQLTSAVVSWDDATSHKADWGEMRFYFRGETRSTQDVLTAVAVVKPGKSVHPAHRHAAEEYLVIAEGSGKWSLDGKEIPAKRGDVLFVEPWVFHGVTNTGDVPLVFMVVRYNPKGMDVPPRPDDRPDEK